MEYQSCFKIDKENNLYIPEERPKKAAPQPPTRQEINRCYEYCTAFLKLLDDLGDFLEAAGLATIVVETPYKEWENNVKDVLSLYWRQDPGRVDQATKRRKRLCEADMRQLSQICEKVGLDPLSVNDQAKLLVMLCDPHRRGAYRGYLKRRQNKGEILSPQQLEEHYREKNPAKFAKSSAAPV